MSRKAYLKHKTHDTNNLLMRCWHFCVTFDVTMMIAGKNQAALAVCAQTKIVFPFKSKLQCRLYLVSWHVLYFIEQVNVIYMCHLYEALILLHCIINYHSYALIHIFQMQALFATKFSQWKTTLHHDVGFPSVNPPFFFFFYVSVWQIMFYLCYIT